MHQHTTHSYQQDSEHKRDFQHRPSIYSYALWTRGELTDFYRQEEGSRWRTDSESRLMQSGCANETVDCTHQIRSPATIRGRHAMRKLVPGQVLELITPDDGEVCDVIDWVQEDGHELLQSLPTEEGAFCFRIRKTGGPKRTF